MFDAIIFDLFFIYHDISLCHRFLLLRIIIFYNYLLILISVLILILILF